MTSLKRSFLYAALLFAVLYLLIFLVISLYVPKEQKEVRTSINPAQFITRHLENSKKASKQKPVKHSTDVNKPLPKNIAQKNKAKKEIKKRPKPAKKMVSSVSSPKAKSFHDSFISSIENLPEAVESAPQISPQEEMLQELYGSDLTRLSTKAKQYLLDNHLKMQIITQNVLNRIGRVYLDPRFRYYDYNTIEFMLYPDGHIGPIKILHDAGFKLLDKITKETIETAYKDYPRPTEPILVRYRFLYDLRG